MLGNWKEKSFLMHFKSIIVQGGREGKETKAPLHILFGVTLKSRK